ncbi:MAG: trigger factor [Candidatus Zixiibacteriota bacterium]
MKVELKQGEGLVRELSVEIPAATVQTETEKKFQEVKEKTTLKGFRKGKAPLTMIRSMFAEQVKADVVDDLIKSTLPEAVKGQALNIASRPTLTDFKFTDDGGFVYVAKVEIFPEVTTVKYDGLKVTSTPVDVNDEEVNDVVEHIRKKLSELRPVDRESREGDLVVVDLKKVKDPKLVIKSTEFLGSEVDLGNPMTVKEFRDQLIGVKAGEVKPVEVKYPQDYSDTQFAGAEIWYEATIKQVKERILPELSDAFAKQTGQAETLLELKLKIREDIGRQKTEAQSRMQRREIVHQICEINPIPIPDGMVEDYLDAVVEDFKKNYKDADEAEIRKGYRQTGVDTMRWDILWHTLATQEKLEISTTDTENWIQGFAAHNNLTMVQAREALSRSGRANSLRESMLEEKVVEFLRTRAQTVTIGA